MIQTITVENVKELHLLYFIDKSIPTKVLKKNNNKNYLEKWREFIKIHKPVDYRVEKYIINERLKNGTYDAYSLAWKAGRLSYNEYNKDVEFCGFSDKDKCGNSIYRNEYGNTILKESFKEYYDNIKGCSKEINDKINTEDDDKWEVIYNKAYSKVPVNMGPVNIINALFFITKGKAPIYDRFVHRAAKALFMEISPSDVYLGSNPEKKEVDKVVKMYKEYMILLKKLFPKEIGKDNCFISRELDRALWVYGHANNKWMDNNLGTCPPSKAGQKMHKSKCVNVI